MIPVACRIFRVLILPCLALFLVFQLSPATAATFCVSTAEELQAALTTAADNGEDDEIRIVQGSYYGNFVYTSTEPYGLITKGGYTADCSSRIIDPQHTVLDGGLNGTVLVLSNSAANNCEFTLQGLTFQNGYIQQHRGGGLYVNLYGAHLQLTNCIIKDSYSLEGGGAYIYNTAFITAHDNLITNNTSGKGGGLSIIDFNTALITKNLLMQNESRESGGGFYARGKEVSFDANTVSSNLVSNSYGGGVTIEADIINFINNQISTNQSTQFAGGAHLSRSNQLSGTINCSIANNIIIGNETNGVGSAIVAHVGLNEGILNLTNNTIYNNSSWETYPFQIYIGLYGDFTIANIYNNIVFDTFDTSQGSFYIENDRDRNYVPGEVNMYNNNFNQSNDNIYIQLPFAIDPSNLSNADPLFVDPENDAFHLQATSPCINTGSNDAPGLPATDKDGFPRIVGTSVDMGAYEYQGFIHPVAGFSAYPLSGVAPLTVFFTDESTGTIDAWQWKFGDGSTSSERNPTHIYNAPGIFSVSLTVIGDSTAWDTETKTDYITVISPDAPDLYGRCRAFHSRDFGAWIRIIVQIGNQGNQRARDFSIAFYLSDDGFTLGPLLDYSLVRGNLQPGSTRDIPMKYSSPTTLSGKYVIAVIDQENSIVELDETNNEIVIRIP